MWAAGGPAAWRAPGVAEDQPGSVPARRDTMHPGVLRLSLAQSAQRLHDLGSEGDRAEAGRSFSGQGVSTPLTRWTWRVT
jgi:hypothetical protein